VADTEYTKGYRAGYDFAVAETTDRIIKDLKRITIVDTMGKPLPNAIQDIVALLGGK
jgi:hypothetical protein